MNAASFGNVPAGSAAEFVSFPRRALRPTSARAWLIGLILGVMHATERPASSAELTSDTYQNSVFRTCRVDLVKDDLRMFWRDGNGAILGTLERLQQQLRSQGRTVVCATNAGIYQTDLRPLGLYIEQGRVLHRLNTRKGAYGNFYFEPNGVFVIEDGRARIVETDRFQSEFEQTAASIRFATQSGPILLQDGAINPRFAPRSVNRLTRNAVCLVSEREVLLAISDTPVSFHEFARFLRDSQHCKDALHLDSSVSRLIPPESFSLGPPFGVLIAVTRAGRPEASTLTE